MYYVVVNFLSQTPVIFMFPLFLGMVMYANEFAMFLLVSKFKIIGMLLKVVHSQVQKKLTKTYNTGFPNHCTLINYDVYSQNMSPPTGHRIEEGYITHSFIHSFILPMTK